MAPNLRRNLYTTCLAISFSNPKAVFHDGGMDVITLTHCSFFQGKKFGEQFLLNDFDYFDFKVNVIVNLIRIFIFCVNAIESGHFEDLEIVEILLQFEQKLMNTLTTYLTTIKVK